MESLGIYLGNTFAGVLTQRAPNEYEFTYDAAFCMGDNHPISPTLPVTPEPYRSQYLFPFFSNLLPEGGNRRTVCQQLHIDESDSFALLASFAGSDFIGNISVTKL